MNLKWTKEGGTWSADFFAKGFQGKAAIAVTQPLSVGVLSDAPGIEGVQVAPGRWFVPMHGLAIRAKAFHDQAGFVAHHAVDAARKSIAEDGLKLLELERGSAAAYAVTVTVRRGVMSVTKCEAVVVRKIGLRGPQPHFASLAQALSCSLADMLQARISALVPASCPHKSEVRMRLVA